MERVCYLANSQHAREEREIIRLSMPKRLIVQQRHHTFHMTRPTKATAAKNKQAATAASMLPISESRSDLLQPGRFPGIYVNHVNTINVHNHPPRQDERIVLHENSPPVEEEETGSSRLPASVAPQFNENVFQKAASKTGTKLSLRKPTTNGSAANFEGSDDDENDPSVEPPVLAQGTGRTARTRSKTTSLRVLEETAEAPENSGDQYLPTKSAKGYTYVSPSSVKVPESDQYQSRIEEARNSVSEPAKKSQKTAISKTNTSAPKGRNTTGPKKAKAAPKATREKALDHIPAALLELSPGKRRFSEVSTPFITYNKTDTPAIPSSSIERDFEEMRGKGPSAGTDELTAMQDNEADAALGEDLEIQEDPPVKRKKDKHVVEMEDQDTDQVEDIVSPGNKSAGYVDCNALDC